MAAPQEPVGLDVSYDAALKQFETMCAAVNTYNDAVNAVNAEVTAKKAAAAAGDLKMEEAALVRLNAQKKRHSESVAALCADYKRLGKEKATLEEKKAQVRAKLEAHSDKVMKPYHSGSTSYSTISMPASRSHRQNLHTEVGSPARHTSW
jgi:septal ring factor EnvC (AmiA/AmiB activator)